MVEDGAGRLEQTLAAWLREHPEGALAVAFSGGGDSTALLAALARLPEARRRGLRALHVDHGLAADSARWAEHCKAVAASLGIACLCLSAKVAPSGYGIEAAARRARYRLLAQALAPQEWLLLAHHAEDQAETILLRLLRGASPRLLAGMPAMRRLGQGFLARPLLGLSRTLLRSALADYGLAWIEDPANRDPRFDRGYLREKVLPAIAARFPAFAERVAASGRMIAATVSAFATKPQLPREGEDRLDLAAVLARPPAQAAFMLELWLSQHGLRPPSGARLSEFLRQLATAARDRAPILRGEGWQLRRFREQLFLLPDPISPLPPDLDLPWDGAQPLALPDGSLLTLEGCGELRFGLRVRARRGGERIRLVATGGRRLVKELMRVGGVPPWERGRLPFLWLGERLVAVGERWLDAEFAARLAAAGRRLRHRRPLAAVKAVE